MTKDEAAEFIGEAVAMVRLIKLLMRIRRFGFE